MVDKTTLTPINFFKDYEAIQPSLFRESHNLHKVLKSIFGVYEEQQDDFLWLAENILDIDKAEKSQLDFIGSLVGQDRFLIDYDPKYYFGFYNAYHSDTFGAKGAPYVGSVWRSRGGFDSQKARRLSDDEYRRLIKARVINNQADCTSNELLEVINLITNTNKNSVQVLEHGYIKIKSADKTGLLSYFVDKIDSDVNILPIAAGVRVYLEAIAGETQLGEEMTKFVNLLSKLVNIDFPRAIGAEGYLMYNYPTFPSDVDTLVNEELPEALNKNT